jgi:cyclopropane-fatty-acyl-phospholipid synthase
MNWFDRFACRQVRDRLSQLSRGTIRFARGSDVLMSCEQQPSGDNLEATIYVHRPSFFRSVMLGGTLSAAESYLQGDWDCDNLTTLFRIFARNLDTASRMDRGLAALTGVTHRLYHWLHSNTPAGSRKNIGAHYDLGNDFFRLWLDDSMAYSSAIFPGPESTLLEGSQEKFDRVCRKLDLQPTDHLLEIGTGWGGLAVHAAKHYGCRVTTTTISRQQAEIAAERIQESGVADRVTLLREDYRELTGKYDKLVSIEMIEAVGHRFMDEYLGKCSDLLKPEGTALLQAIVMPEQRFEQYLRSVDFIQRYIFPGGCLPSIASVLDASGRSTDFRLVHAEDFAPHYAATLRHWKEGFESQKDSILKLGYSEQFVRLWRYYLCYCEAVFEERQVGVVHLQFDKPLTKRDPINLSAMASRPQSTGLSSLSSDMLRNSASSEKQDSR